MAANEPIDPRVRLEISQWPEDASRGAVSTFCAEHGISRKSFYELRKRAMGDRLAAVLEPSSRRPRSNPSKLTDEVKAKAAQVRVALEASGLDHGPISVHDKMHAMRLEVVTSVASLARIFRQTGVARLEPKKKPRSAWRRFVYPAPNACWQLDATNYVLTGGRRCVIFQLIDDHSRYAVASHVAWGETAQAAITVFGKAVAAHGVPQRLLSDNGLAPNPSRRRYLGQLVEHVSSLGTEAITGKPYKPTTQGKNERFHQKTLFRYLDKHPLAETLANCRPRSTRSIASTTPNAPTRGYPVAARHRWLGRPRRRWRPRAPRPPARHRSPETPTVTDVLMQNRYPCPETSHFEQETLDNESNMCSNGCVEEPSLSEHLVVASFSIGGLSPAEVLGAASREVAVLDDRLWAAVEDKALVDGLIGVQSLRSHLAAVEARMLAEVDDREIARKQLHWGSTADWFIHIAGVTRRDGTRAVAQAHSLVAERSATLAALRSGEVSPAQASIVCAAMDRLPCSPALRAKGELVLLEEAGRLNATDLARTARHLAEIVDPDRAERRDEAALAREERSAHLGRFYSITEDGMGGVWVKGHGSTEDGALLKAVLLPLTKPAPPLDSDGPDCESEADPRDHGARMWDALVQVAQHSLDTDQVPASHGARPRVAVSIDLDSLRGQFVPGAEAVTDDGLRLSVAAVRRLACDAEVIPVVLGTDGEVLDVGRTSRLVTPALWRALVARDRHCAFPGCTKPPVMGHAHHIAHWADGGSTCLENLVLVCGGHHRVLHHTPWQVRLNPADHRPEFLPPPRPGSSDPVVLDWIRHRPRRE